jgi:hypothetical protein
MTVPEKGPTKRSDLSEHLRVPQDLYIDRAESIGSLAHTDVGDQNRRDRVSDCVRAKVEQPGR